jgi:VWFA-related protein
MSPRVVCLAALCTLTLLAQPRPLVVVDAQVVDTARNRPVAGLTPADFEVLDNGEPQRVAEVRYGGAPLDLIVLEATGDPAELGAVRQTIAGLADGFRELHENDRVRLATLSPRGTLSLDSAAEGRAVGDKVLRASAGTGAASPRRLFDGIAAAASLFATDPGLRRRAILVITDSWESGSKATSVQTVAAALRAGATVYVLVLPRAIEPPRGSPRAPNLAWQGRGGRSLDGQSLQPLAAATGGEVVWQLGGRRRAKELVSRLEQRYQLAYPMPESSVTPFRTLAVSLKEPLRAGKLVRARTGYYVK